jgi:DNA invertase Pin-like site-specific DNA recombinase
MKTAIYIRVSTRDKQDISKQRDWLINYAREKKWDVYKVYQDVGISGAKQQRPALNEMLKDISNYDIVLVYKIDRIGRSFKHLFKLMEIFKENKIEFVSATQPIDTTTPGGKLFFNLLAAFAEFEREMIVQRINDGLTIAKKRGVKLGRKKGSKDKKPRKKIGYYQRYANKKSK